MKALYIGTDIDIKAPEKGGYLRIGDTLRKVRGAHIFDYKKHSFDLFADLDYPRICAILDMFDALFSESGEGTLTKDTGLDFIGQQLKMRPHSFDKLIPEPDKKSTTGQIWAYGKVQRILLSPVLSRVLCGGKPLSFTESTVVLAPLNRAELTEFDALALGLALVAVYKHQLVIDDLGFYGRNGHVSLIRQDRLIAGVHRLSELPEKLRGEALQIKERIPMGAVYDDAVALAKAARLRPDALREDNPYNKFIDEAMAGAVA